MRVKSPHNGMGHIPWFVCEVALRYVHLLMGSVLQWTQLINSFLESKQYDV